ncbi:UNVERIFIED_CONTAM: hypothetical protein NCL1_30501 [Trichonephila clavipes]
MLPVGHTKWVYPYFTTTERSNFKKKKPIIISIGSNSESTVTFSKIIVEPLYRDSERPRGKIKKCSLLDLINK